MPWWMQPIPMLMGISIRLMAGIIPCWERLMRSIMGLVIRCREVSIFLRGIVIISKATQIMSVGRTIESSEAVTELEAHVLPQPPHPRPQPPNPLPNPDATHDFK